MKKYFIIIVVSMTILLCGCSSIENLDTPENRKMLLQLIEQLREQDRISETNYNDLKKALNKE